MRIVPQKKIPSHCLAVDIGPQTIRLFEKPIREAKTIFWNGPMGYFEREPFASGTRVVARALIDLTSNGGIAVIGGGDTMAALYKFNMTGPMTHMSTGGGSLLEFIDGKPLPGVRALSDSVEVE